MRTRAWIPLLLSAGLLVHSADASTSSAATPFVLTADGAIIVSVTVNGSRAVAFLLDTGSNGSVISDELAASLGLNPVARTTLTSAAGGRDMFVVKVDGLDFGPIRGRDVLATIVPARELQLADAAAVGRNVQGVIGQDLLEHLRYTIDYHARRIDWHTSPADVPCRATPFELERQDDRFLVRIRQDTGDLRLVPDSGSATLVLSEHGAVVAGAIPTAGTVGVSGLAGTRQAQVAIVRKLRVGEKTLTDVPAVIVRRDDAPSVVDGLLPLHLFARVTFDGPTGRMFVE